MTRVYADVNGDAIAQLVVEAQPQAHQRGGAVAPQHDGVSDALHDLGAVFAGDPLGLGRESNRQFGRDLVPADLRQPGVTRDVSEEERVELFLGHSVT